MPDASQPRIVSPEEAQEARHHRKYGAHTVPWIAQYENGEQREKRIRHVNAWATEPECRCDWCFILRRLDEAREQGTTEPDRTRAAVVKALRAAADRVAAFGHSSAALHLRQDADEIENGAPL